MTKHEILQRMTEMGEKLRWVSREISEVPCESRTQVAQRDLFLGKQILTTDELTEVMALEDEGSIICEDAFGDVIRYWLPGEDLY